MCKEQEVCFRRGEHALPMSFEHQPSLWLQHVLLILFLLGSKCPSCSRHEEQSQTFKASGVVRSGAAFRTCGRGMA